MKKSILIILTVALTSCQFRKGGSDGTYAAVNIGMRERGVVQTPQTYVAEETSGVESFQNFTSLAKTIAYLDAAKAIAKTVSSAYSSVTNTKTAASVSKANAAADVKKTAIEAKTAETALKTQAQQP